MAVIEINWNPPAKDLRIFAVLEMLFCGVVALWLHRRGVSPAISLAILGLSAGVGVAGLIRPAWMRPVYVAWMAAAFPLGWLVSHALLAVIFYLLLFPVGVVMRLLGRDPLERSSDKAVSTYWKKRDTSSNSERYFKQY